jgi:uncharacterized protein YukE
VSPGDPLAGEPRGIRAAARRLEGWADEVRAGGVLLRDTDAAATSDWRGEASDRFRVLAQALDPAAGRVASRVEGMAETLAEFAREVERIQDEARRIRGAQAAIAARATSTEQAVERHRMVVDGPDAVESDHLTLDHLLRGADEIALLESRFDAEWTELVEQRARADRRAAAALTSSEVLGDITVLRRSSTSAAEFLDVAARLPPELLAVVGADAALAERLGAASPEVVVAWWASLSPAARDALIVGLPGVIGNLNGVPYGARDRANRRALDAAWDDANAALNAAADTRERGDDSKAASRAYESALEIVQALRNFRAGRTTPLDLVAPVPRQIVSFHPGPPPLGSISLGELDTADSVAYLVPGMGSSLASTTETMRASANVLRGHQLDARPATALVTWIGYEAPPAIGEPGGLGVLGDAYAERGAVRLASDLRGLRSTRPAASIDVIGHSYGSTTAAIALASDPTIGVASFIALGSAGIPKDIPDATATNAVNVYAAQAAERGDIAYAGRMYSGRLDPADGFGATTIDTFSGGRVDSHALLINGPARPDRFGYLDQGTNSLDEVVRLTGR